MAESEVKELFAKMEATIARLERVNHLNELSNGALQNRVKDLERVAKSRMVRLNKANKKIKELREAMRGMMQI